jgi:hypothetical protein
MKSDFETFFRATEPERYGNPYIYGTHTLGLIDVCQKAFNKLQNGISSYIIVNIPYRHGKSDVISRRFPVWALLNNPRLQIMEGCATGDLAKEMSYDARKCFERHCSLYNTKNEKDFNTATSWRTINGGGMFGSGLGGTVVGKGADICIVDDYYRNRADADSELIRNKVREGFTNDFMTRLAPVHIVLIVSTRWHEADLCGWILDKNNPDHEEHDSSFPVFEHLKYQAQNDDGSFLFPERFKDEYYNYQKSTLGEYGWNALAQQDPRPRQGNILKAERCKIVDKIEMNADMEWHLGIDLAHSDEGKGDPDYTVITLACFFEGKIYVKSVWRFRKSVLERDIKIKSIVSSLPEFVDMIIEQAGASKDAFLSLRNEFEEFLMVRRYINRLGKLGHATKLEPIFELGNVILEKADWNMGWINELKAVPGGKHDDQMDSLYIAISREIVLNKYMFTLDEGKKEEQNTQEEIPALKEDDYF